MPSAPLYYQPIVQARIAMTPIGSTPDGPVTIHDAVERNLNFEFVDPGNGSERMVQPTTDAAVKFVQEQGEAATEFAKYLTGVETLQKASPNSQVFDRVQIAQDETGWIANRVQTAFRNHPGLLDQASPDQAEDIAKNLAEQAKAEWAKRPGIMASGTTLEMGATAAQVLGKQLDP
ncbi:MAG: hypothetical protein JWO69_1317, partial [Thermoleophilia bacterium]|nr:hypothetical protein [Thermoleophilia bacterium]